MQDCKICKKHRETGQTFATGIVCFSFITSPRKMKESCGTNFELKTVWKNQPWKKNFFFHWGEKIHFTKVFFQHNAFCVWDFWREKSFYFIEMVLFCKWGENLYVCWRFAQKHRYTRHVCLWKLWVKGEKKDSLCCWEKCLLVLQRRIVLQVKHKSNLDKPG